MTRPFTDLVSREQRLGRAESKDITSESTDLFLTGVMVVLVIISALLVVGHYQVELNSI